MMGVTLFRANIGRAWTGDDIITLPNGDVLIKNARPFSSGLPPGFSDLFGITDEGKFVAVEVKSESGRPTEQQQNFIQHIQDNGGLAGVARSVEDFKDILKVGD